MRSEFFVKMIVFVGLFVVCDAWAEFGVSAGASFNYKAKFQSGMKSRGFAHNPNSASAGRDHFYDDGYNRVDSSGNYDNETTFWGYYDASQSDGSFITMNSSQTILNRNEFSADQDDAQPAFEIYWQEDLTDNKRWNVGVRAALRWQRIELDQGVSLRTTRETISDSYALNNVMVPDAPFSGSFMGPNALISDVPLRSVSRNIGSGFRATRDFDANILASDIGPTVSLDFTEKFRAVASAGGTVAWIRGEFSYEDAGYSKGEDDSDDWLLGGYASADLEYRILERWGVFSGVAYTLLEDFEQESNGRSMKLQFDDSYTIRAGIFFR